MFFKVQNPFQNLIFKFKTEKNQKERVLNSIKPQKSKQLHSKNKKQFKRKCSKPMTPKMKRRMKCK